MKKNKITAAEFDQKFDEANEDILLFGLVAPNI